MSESLETLVGKALGLLEGQEKRLDRIDGALSDIQTDIGDLKKARAVHAQESEGRSSQVAEVRAMVESVRQHCATCSPDIREAIKVMKEHVEDHPEPLFTKGGAKKTLAILGTVTLAFLSGLHAIIQGIRAWLA